MISDRYMQILVPFMVALVINGCESDHGDPGPENGNGSGMDQFPTFITSSADYFNVSIGDIPDIDTVSYRLEVKGAVKNPASFSLAQLKAMQMVERTVTIECIGNPANGELVGTATWKGFRLYNLLETAGISEKAVMVKYTCADGYYTYNSIDELREGDVIGALYMNGGTLPSKYGKPLRIIFPGYYGVRQPGWIVDMEVMETMEPDFWSKTGWHTDSMMTIDSRIFFPGHTAVFSPGESIRVGGAAYGSNRVSSVAVTIDNGKNWIPATIINKVDKDFVWVFWEAYVTAETEGKITIHARAVADDGRVQVQEDPEYLDGTNSWPGVTVTVER